MPSERATIAFSDIFALQGRTERDLRHQVQIPFNADWAAKAPSPLPNIPLPKLGVLPANLVKPAKDAASRRKKIRSAAATKGDDPKAADKGKR